MKKNFLKFVCVMLAALMMVGCLTACGEEKKAAEPSTADAQASASESAPAAEAAPAEAAGEINIALITNTTGDYAMYGVPVHNGAMIYFNEVNAAGGINGKQIKVLEYDDKADGVESVNAFNLAKEQNISAVLGSVLTGATIALSDATYDANMPQVTASATAAGVTMIDPDNPDSEIRTNVFRSCFIDPFQGEKMADYIYNKMGAKTVAIFYETGSDYSEGVMATFVETAEKLGLEVVDTEAFATGDKDYKAQMTNIAAKNPDVIYAPIYYGEAGLAVSAARAAGCKAPFVGGDGFGSIKDYASAEDLEGTVYCSGYAPGTDSVAKFESDYKTIYGEEVPNMFAPLAYDAAMLLCEGLKAAEAKGLTAGTDEYRQAVIDGIKAVNGLEGITGTYAFDKYNNPIKSAAIIELTGGEEKFKEMY